MTSPKHANDPLVEDGAEAYRKFEDFTRRILAVPKKEIDKRLTKEKAARKAKRTRG